MMAILANTEAEDAQQERMDLRERADKRFVICMICRKWVKASRTLAVAGNKNMRAHICLEHLDKLP